jgi:hypothetical protein
MLGTVCENLIMNVFEFVGPGHFFEMSICTAWTDLYSRTYDKKTFVKYDLKDMKGCCENGFRPSSFTSARCAALNKLGTIKWLRGNGHPCTPESCEAAARVGNLSTLKWLHNSGVKWNYKTVEAAVENCHLEILKYAKSRNCKWTHKQKLLLRAVENGDLPTIKYLRSRYVKWHPLCLVASLSTNDMKVIRYVLQG